MIRLPKAIAVLGCMMLTASCAGRSYDIFSPQKPDMIDPALQLTRDDYKKINHPGGDGAARAVPPPIPELADILAAPKPPKLGQTQLVSVAVTDDVPLKDVFIELARLAKVDVEVDAGITGGVDFTAKDRPFNEVVDRLCDLAGLRYSMKDNVLRIERDTPYVQVYSLDFLNMDRSAESSVNISTSVLSSTASAGGSGGGSGGGGSSGGGSSGGGGGGSSGGGGGGLENGSSSTITSKTDSDFWKQFESSVKQILKYKPPRRVSETAIAEQPNAPVTGESSDKASSSASAKKSAPSVQDSQTDKQEADSGSSGAGTGTGTGTPGSFYILNRQASTLTVSGTEKQQAMVRTFLKEIEANVSSQVLIEAKIIEVTLDDQFQSGINWKRFGSSKFNLSGNFNGFNLTSSPITNVGTITLSPGDDLNTLVSLAEQFGTTRTLSSPRLHAMNNQEAVLTFAQNDVYFSITATQTQSTATISGSSGLNTITINSMPHTVPIGIIMSLQPSVDTQNSTVTLNVHPTLSRIVGTVTDPAIAFTLAQAVADGIPASDLQNISASVPIVEVRELDSLMKLKSGQVMVIGGLMQDQSNNTEAGIPGADSVPWLGNLFKGDNRENKTSELVIFIRATIVGNTNDADKADKNVYQKFTSDPRPIKF